MVTSSIWLGWCNSGKIFTCNELKGTTANGKTFDPPLCPNQSFWDQKALFGLVEMTYFHRFSRTIHGVLRKTFCASFPVWSPHAHLFLESWKPGCIQICTCQLENLFTLNTPQISSFHNSMKFSLLVARILIYWKTLKYSRAKTTESLKLWWQASISTASSRRWVDKIYPARELLET